MSLIKRFSQLGKKKKEKPCMSDSILTILSCCAHKNISAPPKACLAAAKKPDQHQRALSVDGSMCPLCCHSHTHNTTLCNTYPASSAFIVWALMHISTLTCQNTVSVNDLFVLFLQNLYSVCVCVCPSVHCLTLSNDSVNEQPRSRVSLCLSGFTITEKQ